MTSRKRSINGEDGVTVLLPLDVNPIVVKNNIIGSLNFGCCCSWIAAAAIQERVTAVLRSMTK
jgi:hypothetical protein